MATYNEKKKLLFAYCSSGTLLIEAALFNKQLLQSSSHKPDSLPFSQFSPIPATINKKQQSLLKIYGVDKLSLINAAKRNAKIAGVYEHILLSTELPTGDEERFDMVIVRLHTVKHLSAERIAVLFDKLAHLLVPNGTLLCFSAEKLLLMILLMLQLNRVSD